MGWKRKNFMTGQVNGLQNRQIHLKDFIKRINTNFSKEGFSEERKMFQSDRKVKQQYAINKFRIKKQNNVNVQNQTHNHFFNVNSNQKI